MDGSAFIYRGFFANRNMQRSDGFPTNALVVVTRVLLRIPVSYTHLTLPTICSV